MSDFLGTCSGCSCAPPYWCFSAYGIASAVDCGDDQGDTNYTSPAGASTDGHMDVVYPYVTGFDYSVIPFSCCQNGGSGCGGGCAAAGYTPASGFTLTNPGSGCLYGVSSFFDWNVNYAACGRGGDSCVPAETSPGIRVGAIAAGFWMSTNISFMIGRAVYSDSTTLTVTETCHQTVAEGGGCCTQNTGVNWFYIPPPPLSLASSYTCTDFSGTATVPLGAYYFVVGANEDQTGTLQTSQSMGGDSGTFHYASGGTPCMSSGDPFDGDPP